MAFHKNLTGTDIHVPHAWSYADSTARDAATGFILSDVGKLSLQLDNFSYWTLTSISPITWQAHGATVVFDYKGDWNATTNTPTLSDSGGGGASGDIYRVSVAGATGLDGESTWNIGDYVVNLGTRWERWPNSAEVHIADTTSNPHSITTTTIGAIPTSEKGAANGVATLGVDSKVPTSQLPTEKTYANIGAEGIGTYAGTVVSEVQFRKIAAASNKVSVTQDTHIDIDVVPGNISHQGLSGAGSNTHSQIDSHISSTLNPHSVTAAQASAVPTSEKGVANGVATLNSEGKIPSSQLTFTGLSYAGSWNADTNTPTLSNGGGGGTSGEFYIVSVDGTTTIDGVSSWSVGDWALNDGTAWERVPATAPVTSVAGKTGEVTLVAGDVGLGNVTNDAQLKRSASDFYGFSEKASPDNGDLLLIEDFGDSYNKKKIQLANLPYVLETGDTITGDLILDQASAEHVAFYDSTKAFDKDDGYFEYHPATHTLVLSGQGDTDWSDPLGAYGQYDTYLPNSLIDVENDVNPGLSISTSRGTGESPSVNINGDFIGRVCGWCYTGDPGDYHHVGGIGFWVEGSTAQKGGTITFHTSPDGVDATCEEAMRINNMQRLLIGQTTDDGTNKVQITGDTKITGNLSVTGTVPNATDANAIHDNVAAEISAISEKTTLTGADLILIEDSAASNAKKRATITNLSTAVAPIFGQHFAHAEDEAESSTTSTAPQQKLRLSVSSLTAGTYRIGWSYRYRLSSISYSFRSRVQVDDTDTIDTVEVEPKDAASSQRTPASGFAYVTLTSGNHYVDLDYATSNSGVTAYIYDTRLEIWRVS